MSKQTKYMLCEIIAWMFMLVIGFTTAILLINEGHTTLAVFDWCFWLRILIAYLAIMMNTKKEE